MARRTLYHLPGCPDCEKVRLAFAVERLEYRAVEIDRNDRAEVERVSGQRSVPVLVDEDGTVEDDANRILKRISEVPGSALLPPGRRAQFLAWVLVERADEILGPLTKRLRRERDPDGRALSEDDLEVLRRKLEEELGVLEGLLETHPFLFGDRPTLADIAYHAFLNRLDAVKGLEIPDDLVRARGWYRRVAQAAGR